MKNCRPIAIIIVVCKLFKLMVRERINEWEEDSGLMVATEDNLFIQERLIEMVREG